MAKGIDYKQLTQKALLQVMVEVLTMVARDGLPGDHHFFINFDTTHPGVDMDAGLRAKYPKDMTIILQDWFEDLAVMKDRFSVTLNFGNVPEPIVIPFAAIKTFADPSVEFGFRFEAPEDAAGSSGGDTRGGSGNGTPLKSVPPVRDEGHVVVPFPGKH